jgi:hypothetical protein
MRAALAAGASSLLQDDAAVEAEAAPEFIVELLVERAAVAKQNPRRNSIESQRHRLRRTQITSRDV